MEPKTLSLPWRPYKLTRSRSPCARKSWRASVLASRVVSTELIPPVCTFSAEVQLWCAKPYRHTRFSFVPWWTGCKIVSLICNNHLDLNLARTCYIKLTKLKYVLSLWLGCFFSSLQHRWFNGLLQLNCLRQGKITAVKYFSISYRACRSHLSDLSSYHSNCIICEVLL